MKLNMISKNLKIGLALLLALHIFIGCSEKQSESKKGFTITGNIAGIQDGFIYLMKAGNYFGYTFEKVDSTKIIRGKFKFKGNVDFSEMYYLTTIDNQSISFFIENSNIKIEGDIEELKSINISGSKGHSDLIVIQPQIDSLQTDGEKREYIRHYIKDNHDSSLNPYLILNYVFNLASFSELNDFYNLISSEQKDHWYSKQIKNQLTALEAVQIGNVAPNFIEKDTIGNDVSLKTFRGSYVLIDFWASWCGPCRVENPAMVELYNELKTKELNFEIIGVAGDFVEDRWKNAIVKDKLPWTNISDLKGFDGKALKLFGIKSIPYTVLLDPDGRIIEKGLTGEELRMKIREIYKTD